MSTLLIEGGRRLSGAVDVEGNKNAALPLLAACLLTTEECVLTNVPRIGDVEVMARLLIDLGAEVEGIGTTTLARAVPGGRQGRARPRAGRPAARLGAAARAAARAARPRAAGAARRRLSGAPDDRDAPRGARRDGRARRRRAGPRARGARRPASRRRSISTKRRSPAPRRRCSPRPPRPASRRSATRRCEPHVVELCEFLQKLGVGDHRRGHADDSRRRRRAAARRHAPLWGDYIEAGSWAVVAAVTGGEIEVRGARAEDMEVVAAVLEAAERRSARWTATCSASSSRRRRRPAASRPACGPGFPSDLVSLVTVLATQAEGRTLVHDWMYELRLFALEQMSGMRADLFLCDPHRIIVTGPRKLRGRPLDSRDLRSGMALIAAALAADGQSRVAPLETVERGYAQLVERLQSAGRDSRRSWTDAVRAAAALPDGSGAGRAAAGRRRAPARRRRLSGAGAGGRWPVAAAGGGRGALDRQRQLARPAPTESRPTRNGAQIALRRHRARGRCAASASG